MRKWIPMLILASAQFVMVLDTSVMNVAISQIVDDLDTTIQGVQTAITLYTLVMAAFMLLGAKLGESSAATAPSRSAWRSTGSAPSPRPSAPTSACCWLAGRGSRGSAQCS